MAEGGAAQRRGGLRGTAGEALGEIQVVAAAGDGHAMAEGGAADGGGESAAALRGPNSLPDPTRAAGVADASLPILSERLGFQLTRITPPSPQGFSSLLALGASSPDRAQAAIDQIAGTGAAGTAREFRRAYAPLRRLIANSSSPEEVITGVRNFTAGWNPQAVSDVLLEALTAYAANGAVITDR